MHPVHITTTAVPASGSVVHLSVSIVVKRSEMNAMMNTRRMVERICGRPTEQDTMALIAVGRMATCLVTMNVTSAAGISYFATQTDDHRGGCGLRKLHPSNTVVAMCRTFNLQYWKVT